MDKLRVVYYGTPDFSAQFLKQLLEDAEIPVTVTRVITQSPKKAGRRQEITTSPVERTAVGRGIPVSYDIGDIPENTDIALLFAYGRMIPKEVLGEPKYGFWNIHPSLLPKYRGPAPMAGPLLSGDAVTGVTLILMDDQMDHGPIIAQAEYAIHDGEMRGQLETDLAALGYALFKNTIISHSGNIREISSIRQDHANPTYTKLMKKDDGYLHDLTDTDAMYRKFRAYHPWPGIWTFITIDGVKKRLKIVGMNDQKEITGVQLEGKNPVDRHTFEHAYGPIRSYSKK